MTGLTVARRCAGLMLAALLAGCAASANTGGSGTSLLPFAADPSVPKGAGGLLPPDGELARTLDGKDRALLVEAQFEALERGAPGAARDWANPGNGHAGSITPGPTYSVNQYTCRDFSQRIVLDGKQEQARGTACRHPDGTWRSLS